MKLHQFLFLIITVFLLLGGCASGAETNSEDAGKSNSETVQEEPNNSETTNDEQTDPTPSETDSETTKADEEKPENPEQVADKVLLALEQKNMETFASYVHPTKGVRFSPYAYVHIDEDKVFSAEEMKELMANETVYRWGTFDGSGLPIEMTFEEYYYRFIYDEDFVNAEQKSVNETLGQGNTINNSEEIYPGATVVEYHFTGFDPEFEGMDWRSLRLVLEEENGVWYLVGVIHDEWTI